MDLTYIAYLTEDKTGVQEKSKAVLLNLALFKSLSALSQQRE